MIILLTIYLVTSMFAHLDRLTETRDWGFLFPLMVSSVLTVNYGAQAVVYLAGMTQ